MSKKSRWDWLSDSSDEETHHIEDEYAWAYDEDEDESDESYASEDYTSSRPWGENNDGW